MSKHGEAISALEKKPSTPDFRTLPSDISYTAKTVKIDFGQSLGIRRRSIYKIEGVEFFRNAVPLVSKPDLDGGGKINMEVYKLIDSAGEESKYVVKCANRKRLKQEFTKTPKYLLPRFQFFIAESKKESRLLQIYAGLQFLDFIALNIQEKNSKNALLFTLAALKEAYKSLSELHSYGYVHGDMHCDQFLGHEATLDVTLIDYEYTAPATEEKQFTQELRKMDRITEKALELVSQKNPEKYSLYKAGILLTICTNTKKLTKCKDSADYLSKLKISNQP